MAGKIPLKIKLSMPLSDNFWVKYFDYETIEKSVFTLVKKLPLNQKFNIKTESNTLEIKVSNFKNLLEKYFFNFEQESKERRTKALLKLVEVDLNYKLYPFLDYPAWNNRNKSNQKKKFSKIKRFSNEFDFLYFFEKLVSQNNVKGKKVIVKPNFVSAGEYPETTDKTFLTQIISILEKNKPLSVKIFEGPSIFYDDSFLKKIKFINCPLINTLIHKNLVKVKDRKREISFLIEKEILESDILINLACLKEHQSADFSASKKNLMGLLPSFERLRFHKNLSLKAAINSLAEKLSPTYNIIDARKILIGAQIRNLGGQEKKGTGIYFSGDCFRLDKVAIKENYNEGKKVS